MSLYLNFQFPANFFALVENLNLLRLSPEVKCVVNLNYLTLHDVANTLAGNWMLKSKEYFFREKATFTDL